MNLMNRYQENGWDSYQDWIEAMEKLIVVSKKGKILPCTQHLTSDAAKNDRITDTEVTQ